MAGDEPRRDVVTAAHGLVAVGLNLAAIVFLRAQPHAYQANALGPWLQELRADPLGTQLGAWSFTIGLAALPTFAVGLLLHPSASRLTATGAAWIAIGAILNAAGTLMPLAAIAADSESPLFSLQSTILLDAAFNAFLGFGLLLIALGRDASLTRAQRIGAAVVALVVLPVSMQFTSPAAARWLVVAGPAWIAWVTWVSVSRLRGPRHA